MFICLAAVTDPPASCVDPAVCLYPRVLIASVPLLTLTVPLLVKARLLVVAVPVPVATMSVPLLLNVSGATQQVDALIVPICQVRVPWFFRLVVPLRSTGPEPIRVVGPWRVRAVGVVV